MANFFDRIANFFSQLPLPHAAFQLTTRYLSGIHYSPKERKLKYHFILPLKSGVVEPSFDKKNIKDPLYLKEKISEGARKMHLTKSAVATLIPELCFKVFVFSFDSLPPSLKEREEIIRWRVKKQMPSLPDDVRFSFDVTKENKREKALVSLARASVIREYEDLFRELRIRVKTIAVPTLSLFNLINWEKEKDVLVSNIEEDHISLMAIINSEIALYRLKPFVLDPHSQMPAPQKIENIVKEVENTVNFIEDREKKKINFLWLRLGFLERESEMFTGLREKLSLPLGQIESALTLELNLKEKQMLSPLIGQILWKNQKD
jgi:hypothetical protein